MVLGEALETLEDSQTAVNGHRATLGALQNRLVSTTQKISQCSHENFFCSRHSRVRDTDIVLWRA